jgi:hypothetical protein
MACRIVNVCCWQYIYIIYVYKWIYEVCTRKADTLPRNSSGVQRVNICYNRPWTLFVSSSLCHRGGGGNTLQLYGQEIYQNDNILVIVSQDLCLWYAKRCCHVREWHRLAKQRTCMQGTSFSSFSKFIVYYFCGLVVLFLYIYFF